MNHKKLNRLTWFNLISPYLKDVGFPLRIIFIQVDFTTYITTVQGAPMVNHVRKDRRASIDISPGTGNRVPVTMQFLDEFSLNLKRRPRWIEAGCVRVETKS